MAQTEEQWFECFQAGEQTDSAGNVKSWTYEDLKNIARIYNEKVKESESYEAPIVYGHPETDSPALGWVAELKVEGNKLMALPKKLNPEFVESVKNEEYKKVSIALYDDMMLRHIGFLGATPPAVKGLDPVKFSSNDKFSEYETDNKSESDIPPKNFLTRFIDRLSTIANELLTDNEVSEKPSNNFSITLNERLKRDKPEAYSEYTDGDFADPVHFRFPVKSKSQTIASMAVFSKPNVYSQYDKEEQYYIAGRLIKASANHGITPTPKNWKWSEEKNKSTWVYASISIPVPLESLSRKQLETHIIQSNSTNSQGIVEMEETPKKPEEAVNGLISELVKFLTEIASDEIATQVQAKAEELIPTYFPAPPAEGTAPPAEGMQASEKALTPLEIQQQARIEALEKESRFNAQEKYFNELLSKNKVVPAQKDAVMTVLEMFHEKGFQFSEKSNPEARIKKLIESFPQHNLEDTIAKKPNNSVSGYEFNAPSKSNMDIDDARAELDQKAVAIQRKHAESGKDISYMEALRLATKDN